MLKNKFNNLILCLCLIILVLGSSGNPIFARYFAGSEHQKIDTVTGKPVFDANGNPVMERTSGFQEINSDLQAIAELPTNVPLALRRVNTAVGDVGNVAANTATGKISVGEAVDLVGNVKIGKLRDQKEAENKNNETANSVNNLLGGNAENARETLKTEVNSTTATLGGSNTNANGSQRETYVYDEIIAPNQTMMTPDGQIINKNETAAITETNSKDIGFDVRNPDLQNGVEVERLTTHEASHRAGYGEGASSLLGDVAADVWQKENQANGRTTNTSNDPIMTQANFLANPANAPTLQAGNDWVGNVLEGETLPANQAIKDARVNSEFNPERKHPITGKITKHSGIDFVTTNKNQTIISVADGIVEKVDYQYNSAKKTGWGNYILIDNENGYKTRYTHLAELPNLKEGTQVVEGQPIGEIGKSGGATGKHLHFELLKNNTAINPKNLKGEYINLGRYNTFDEANKAYKNQDLNKK